jgi:carboxypeptidase Taq
VNDKFEALKTRLGEVQDLRRTLGLLGWDQETMMPPKGVEARAYMLGTLQGIAHERFIDDDIGRLLDDLQSFEESMPYDSDEASIIRVTRRDWQKARKVPSELQAELARAHAMAQPVWAEARRTSDYGLFVPYLQKNIELTHRYVDCFGGELPLYDVLLDDYEEGMTSEDVSRVFEDLKRELPRLVAEAAERFEGEDEFMRGPFDVGAQHDFSLDVIRRFGFREDSWRLDPSVHPFASGPDPDDIRLTTRYSENDLTSLFSAMHECGHGLYENGVSKAIARTPLGSGCSYALHESQSRMWENLVGRSRPFWRHFYPRLQQALPSLRDVEEDAFYRAVNRVHPSFIRVDADEVTYGLHIVLRFELEQDILNGRIALADIPEAWNARMKDYLGVDVPEDRLGVLQDIHWSFGSFGYFATYALGTIISVQIWERVLSDLPDLEQQIEAGEFTALREWLRVHLHQHGRKFQPKEMLERVVGGPIDSRPYLRYLKGKLADTAGVKV